ncbi:MAG: SprT-like domain-containing protein [Muribaculaceae bacterium]|nr:SprT-like domain-containing protein [Muribaculaceae bacterium]
MIPTLSFLYDRFSRFNIEMFNGKLSTPTIVLTRSTRSLGNISFTKSRKGGVLTYSLSSLGISKCFDRDESEIEDTLIHEMIHLSQLENGIYNEETAHGPYFRAEMKRINSLYGRNVRISNKGISYSDSEDTIILHYFVLTEFKDGVVTITRMASTKVFDFKRQIMSMNNVKTTRWYGSISPELNRFPRCLKLKFYNVKEETMYKILSHPGTVEMEFVGRNFQVKPE